MDRIGQFEAVLTTQFSSLSADRKINGHNVEVGGLRKKFPVCLFEKGILELLRANENFR